MRDFRARREAVVRGVAQREIAREPRLLGGHAAVIQRKVSRGAHPAYHLEWLIQRDAQSLLPSDDGGGDTRGAGAVDNDVKVYGGSRGAHYNGHDPHWNAQGEKGGQETWFSRSPSHSLHVPFIIDLCWKDSYPGRAKSRVEC